MKSLFAGYYRPTKEEFDELWKNCTFVFDASVLLDLYRSTAKTRNVLLSILEKIKDRIWIPYQAAWEYQENRLEVILTERKLYDELRGKMEGLVKDVQQQMHNHAVESAEKIKAELEEATKKIVAIIDQGAKDHPDLMNSDDIREKITALFAGKVGKKFDEKRHATIFQEGAKRYEQEIPPGYEDAKKGGTRQFGDLVVWNEILEHAKNNNKPVIFVTSDTKEDWWWKQGQFTIGPRPELVQELIAFANVKFYMYNVERFLSGAQKRFDTNVEATEVRKAAEEFKEIEEKREDSQEKDSLSFNRFEILANEKFRRLDARAEARKKWLSTTPVSVLVTLPVGQWSVILADLQGRPCSAEEIAILNDSFTKELIQDFAKDGHDALQLVNMVSIYIEAVLFKKPPVKG
jgi:hypothetical protein